MNTYLHTNSNILFSLLLFFRYIFVIHGGVDGKTRLTSFMIVLDNNKAETVLSGFLIGVDQWGLPVRVR